MPQPGDILRYKEYVFDDGSKGDKLFVVVNTPDVQTPCLALKTTSQAKHYPDVRPGCNPLQKVFFAPASQESCFTRNTYVQLPQLLEFSIAELLTGGITDRISPIGALSSNGWAQLKNCLKQFKYDISEQHWRFIFSSAHPTA